MKEADVLQRITDVDAELIEEASTFTVGKKQVWKVLLPVAASLLLIAGAFSGWYSYSNKVELDENGKIDICSMKRAQVHDAVPEEMAEPEWRFFREADVYPREEYIARIKEEINASELAVVYGTVKNIKMVTVDDRAKYTRTIWEHHEDGTSTPKEKKCNYPVTWVLVTFDIEIIDDLGTLDGRKSVHVVMASRYEIGETIADGYYRLHDPWNIKEMLGKIRANPTGLFMLRNLTVEEEIELDSSRFSQGNVWTIKGKEYRATEFADYYVNSRYDCDGESYHYAGAYDVLLDALRKEE